MPRISFVIFLLFLFGFFLSKPSYVFAASNPIQKVFIHSLQSRHDQLEATQQKLISKVSQATMSNLNSAVSLKMQEYQSVKHAFQNNLTIYEKTPSFTTYLQLQGGLRQLRQSQLDLIKILSNKQQPPIQEPKKSSQEK